MLHLTDVQKSPAYFEGLNLLRFAAAMMILVFHAVEGTVPDSTLKMLVHNFPVAVDFFFIISGFLITWLLLKEKTEQGSIKIFAFCLKRALRIFPLYYLIISITFLYYYGSEVAHINYWPHLFFLGNFETIKDGKWASGFLSPLWTICVEEHFYWIVPLVVALLPIKMIRYFYLLVIIISLIAKTVFAYTTANNFFIINCHTLSKMDVIAMGGLLACFYHAKPFRLIIGGPALGFPLLMIVTSMASVNFFNYSIWYQAVFIKYAVNIPFLIFFCLFVFNDNQFIIKWKRNRWFEYAGSVSYGIYMYHFMVIRMLQEVFIAESVPGKLLFVAGAALITFVLAALSYRYFESPFLIMKNTISAFHVVK